MLNVYLNVYTYFTLSKELHFEFLLKRCQSISKHRHNLCALTATLWLQCVSHTETQSHRYTCIQAALHPLFQRKLPLPTNPETSSFESVIITGYCFVFFIRLIFIVGRVLRILFYWFLWQQMACTLKKKKGEIV